MPRTVDDMLASVTSFALDGLRPRRVTVEVDLRTGLPGLTIVGRGDAAVRESRERVHSALLNAGFDFPQRRITVNLAPAHLPKQGPGFDLATACGILAASGQVPGDVLTRWAVYGELSLSGELRPCAGILAAAEGARTAGMIGIVVPWECGAQAALVDGLSVAPARSLVDVAQHLRGQPLAAPLPPPAGAKKGDVALDLADVRGHAGPVRALEIAAAGGHSLLLTGPPGVGKTMLARRLPGLLPTLTPTEALEVTRIHSITGLHAEGALLTTPPFRAPHHTVSAAGLIGGGAVPKPGEVTLAHRGVLFLDEVAEFSRSALEGLRQPLEDGHVTIVRGQHSARFPTEVLLVAAANPCPCGYGGTSCRCSAADLARYQRRLSGPLLDRLDLLVSVDRPGADELAADAVAVTADVRKRTEAARRFAAQRAVRAPAAREGTGTLAGLSVQASALLRDSYERGRLSARGHARVVRVARTIADLQAVEEVAVEHVFEALAYRQGVTPGLSVAA